MAFTLLANTSLLEMSWDIGTRQTEVAARKYICAPLRGSDVHVLDSPLCFLVADRAPVSRLTHAFCGLQKLSADNSPASRPAAGRYPRALAIVKEMQMEHGGGAAAPICGTTEFI